MNLVMTIIRCEGMYEIYYAKDLGHSIGEVYRLSGASKREVVRKLEKRESRRYRKIYCIDSRERSILINNCDRAFTEFNVVCVTDYEMDDKMLKLVRISKSNTVSSFTTNIHQTFGYFFSKVRTNNRHKKDANGMTTVSI